MTVVDHAAHLLRANPGISANRAARLLRVELKNQITLAQSTRAVGYAIGRNDRKSAKRGPNADVVRPKRTWTKRDMMFIPSAAEEWKPVVLPTPCVVLSLSDLHVPYHDQKAIETAVKFAKKRHKITDLVLNGDYGDFYQISRFEKNIQKRTMAEEIKQQKAGLDWLAKQFRKTSLWYKLGNHDNRWEKYVGDHARELAECEFLQLHSVLGFAGLGYKRVDDQPIMAGKLPVLHGHELNGCSAAVNPARGAFTKTLDSVLIGHLHRTSSHSESNMWHNETTTWSQGCLCDMRPEYARFNKWNQGFAVIVVDRDGGFEVHNYRLGKDYAVRAS